MSKWTRFLQVLNVAFVLLIVSIVVVNEWNCHEGGGCFRITQRQLEKTIETSVRVAFDGCMKQQESKK